MSSSLTNTFSVPKQPGVGIAGQIGAAVKKRRVKRKGTAQLADCLFDRTKKDTMLRMTRLQRITSSRVYEWASGTLIIVNSIWIGFQTQNLAEKALQDSRLDPSLQNADWTEPSYFMPINAVFCALFSIELGLRWLSDGFVDFFRSHDVSWNIFDVTIVGFSLIDFFLEAIVTDNDLSGNVTVLRVLRIARIVRVARVIRFMRFFRELRMMVYSMLGSMKALIWVCLVLIVMFYVFGVSFTAATTSYLRDGGRSGDLIKRFGSLDGALLSLFMAMSGGNDWGMYYKALSVLPFQYRCLFIFFITVSIFAVVNVVTGIFVESAMQSNKKDREIVIHEELEAKQTYLEQMRDVFDEMDTDNTGCISLAEFEKSLDDQSVIAYFNSLKLDVSDARMLFQLMDHDRSDSVSITEFLSGCYKLQGESRSLDTKLMQCEVRFLKGLLLEFSETLDEIRDMQRIPSKQRGPLPVCVPHTSEALPDHRRAA
jgi:hypothetical protein